MYIILSEENMSRYLKLFGYISKLVVILVIYFIKLIGFFQKIRVNIR